MSALEFIVAKTTAGRGMNTIAKWQSDRLATRGVGGEGDVGGCRGVGAKECGEVRTVDAYRAYEMQAT